MPATLVRVTVCELSNEPAALEREWAALAAHVRSEESDLVLLPEMPFHPWVAATREVEPGAWSAAIESHDRWLRRLSELAPARVLGTRPVLRGGRRFNEGFVWEPPSGCRLVHAKRHLPDEEGFWEATWYERGEGDSAPVRVGGAAVGFLICTDLWFPALARAYGRAGAHLVACPRATPAGTLDKWVAGGRTAAVISGAWCLSSNFHGRSRGVAWAGGGWIVEPEEGDVLGITSEERPFLTVGIDLAAAEIAKDTYPRYVAE